MRSDITRKLIDINYQFYQTFAGQFSATRQKIQPGVRVILRSIHDRAFILDLGCGNGNLLRALTAQGFRGSYFGLDFSPELLLRAAADIDPHWIPGDLGEPPIFLQADLTVEGWSKPLGRNNFEVIMALAVFHHLPGVELRLSVLREILDLLSSDGMLMLSVWQLMNSERMRSRIQDWSTAGLTADDVEPGDFLMDWRSGGSGLRYVHQFSSDELEVLAEKSGFFVKSSFSSDGKEGNLGLYQIWIKK